MEEFELKDFNKRIGLNVELKEISKIICRKYGIGEFIDNKIIEIGYEDYNYVLVTTMNKYCVKIFNIEREEENLKEYLHRIEEVAKTEINTPKPIKINEKVYLRLEYSGNIYTICVFEYIDGNNFFELNIKPSEEEIKELARQTALINKMKIDVNFIYDSWAIINFEKEYKKKRRFLDEKTQKEFDLLLEEFQSLEIERLPKGFVHGDIITTNVMKDRNKKLWIIDFAVSNYLPRIIDLAILACNLCLNLDSKEKSINNILILLNEYNRYNKLEKYELENFHIFYKLANAMHIMSTIYIIATEGDSDENQYWLNEGKKGMEFSESLRDEMHVFIDNRTN